MKSRWILRSSLLVTVIVVLVIVVDRRSMVSLAQSSIFLGGAICSSAWAAYESIGCSFGVASRPSSYHDSNNRRADVMNMIAWQLLSIGALQISTYEWVHPSNTWYFEYLIAQFYGLAMYRLISEADSGRQANGYQAFNFLGFPRTRRLVFTIFALAVNLYLIVASTVYSYNGRWPLRHSWLDSGHISLLMIAIMSVLGAALLRSRYRHMRRSRLWSTWTLFVAIIFASCVVATQLLLSADHYLALLLLLACFGSWSGFRYLADTEVLPGKSVGVFYTGISG